jgi:very-short-patch-repair endonuclease
MDELSVLQRLGPKACLSHQTAARQWGIELMNAEGNHVTVPRRRSRVHLPGWQVHRADIRADELIDVNRTRLTAPLRTVLDLARVLPHADAVVAADSALRQSLFSLAALVSSTVAVIGRGASRIRALPAAVDPQSGSVLESLLRVLLTSHGLAPTHTQYRVFNGFHFVGRVDFAWPEARLVVEVDGFAFHANRESYRRDRERDNELERLGWKVLRFTWEDVVGRPDYVVALVAEVLARAA